MKKEKTQKDIKKKKKEGCHLDNQSFINLKSNTMKNTVQIYGFFHSRNS